MFENLTNSEYSFFKYLNPEVVFTIEETFFHIPFLLVMWAFFSKRSPNFIYLSLLILVAFFIESIDLFSMIYSYVDYDYSLNAYNGFIFNRLNFKLFVFTLVTILLVYFYISKDKEYRTIFRAFTIFISGVSIFTLVFFHTLFIGGGLFEARSEKEKVFKSMLYNGVPETYLLNICEDFNMVCYSSKDKDIIKHDIDYINNLIEKINSSYISQMYLTKEGSVLIEKVDVDFSFELGTEKASQVYLRKEKDHVLIILDKIEFDKLTSKFTTYLSILIIAVNLVWIFGGLLIVKLHEKRTIYKYSRSPKKGE